jgi:hypothetical protein
VLLVGPQQRKQRQPGRLDGRVGGQRPSGIVLLGAVVRASWSKVTSTMPPGRLAASSPIAA